MIGKVIVSKFASNSDLNSLFAGRVFPVVGQQTAVKPFAIYEIVTNDTTQSKDSDSQLDEINVRITCCAEKYSETQDAVQTMRSVFVRMNETLQGVTIQSCSFDGERDLFSDDERTFASQVDFVFRVVKS